MSSSTDICPKLMIDQERHVFRVSLDGGEHFGQELSYVPGSSLAAIGQAIRFPLDHEPASGNEFVPFRGIQ